MMEFLVGRAQPRWYHAAPVTFQWPIADRASFRGRAMKQM
jgi:hypothetical protein